MAVKAGIFLVALALSLPAGARAQSQAPATPFLEELTFSEIRDLVAAGYGTVIVPTGGTEDNGAHMGLGKHNYLVAYASDRIARALGKTLVAPVIAYVPEGAWSPPTGHMTRPGTMSLPDDAGYRTLLAAAAESLRAGGFTNIVFLGDSGGNQEGMEVVARELNARWSGSGARAFFASDYYTKAMAEQNRYVAETLHMSPEQMGTHANIVDTSQLMYVAPSIVQEDLLDLAADSTGSDGDPRFAKRALGARLLEIKVDVAAAQIREALSLTADRSVLQPSFGYDEPFPSRTALFLEELTWREVRDAVARGRRVAIVPTGGTEANGFHMATGKHNFLVREGAMEMARALNALIAPVIQYVPESQATPETPGVLSCPEACFTAVVGAAARSLKAGGFEDILLIGDNGGNQEGLRDVAERLNKEWAGTGARVYALTDYYEKGHENMDSYLLATYGWNAETVGSHGGIADTSQLLFARPQHVRLLQLAKSEADRAGARISGDPTKAKADIGRVGIQLKVEAGIAQYRALKAAGK